MTTIDALVEALESMIAEYDTSIEPGESALLDKARAALTRARAEQAALTVPASAFDRLQALCDSQAERIMVMLDAEERRAEQAEPLFWYRPVCHGAMYEGPIHNNSVGGKMLREEKPGEWLPLYTTPPAAPLARLEPLTDTEIDEMWKHNPKPVKSPYAAYICGVVDAEASHNAKLGGAQ